MAQMSEFYMQNRFKMLPVMIKSHRILQSGLDYNSMLNPYTLYSAATQSLPHALQHTEIENYYMIFNVRYIGPIE